MELAYSPDAERPLAGSAPPRRPGPATAPGAVEPADVAVALPVRPDGGSHAVGIGVVVAVHLLIGYALLSGLAQKVVNAVREPVQVRLVEEVRPPPPPPEPPKRIVKVAPRVAPPPPAYVPPPQVVVVVTPPAPTITAVTSTPPVAPPAPPVVAVAAPPAPPARTEPVSIGLVCPTMVKPELPRRAADDGIGGSVRAQATIRAGKVVQVDILASKPRGLFDAAVRTAMLQYGCQSSGTGDVVATQNFEFKAEE